MIAAFAALLFSYFTGNGEDGLHLARSEDGLRWTALNGGKSYLQPNVGENRLMRDPCVMQGPDGMFRMVWTTSWNGKTIGYGASKDLIHWTQEAVPVMAYEPKAANAWAPEIVWNAAEGDYWVFWASAVRGKFPGGDEAIVSDQHPLRNHRLYYTTTKDFKTWAPAQLFYNPGFSVIDATLDWDGDGWVMFAKNESELPTPAKYLFTVRTKALGEPFTAPSPRITGNYWAEGPTAIKLNGVWHVYFDRYRDHHFGLVRSRDLVHWDEASDQLVMPKGIRHGTVFQAPDEVAAKL